jgi:ATP-dependent helicase/nuclease subunit B
MVATLGANNLFGIQSVRDKRQVQARYLLGPAGTGKTYRCLHEIAEKLRKNPEGRDLILVAPKQATFQLERQLLNDFELPGFTRLRILSFERLADHIITKLNAPTLEMLSEEGRVMVLRALLRQRKDLKIFHASASMAGFARQLSGELRELQRHELTPPRLKELSGNKSLPEVLRRKLHDLGLLLEAYTKWLDEHRLRDVDCLLAVAAEQLKGNPNAVLLDIEGLWLDGFAEMTPQEVALLSAVAPHCEQLTLAFCLDRMQTRKSWLSIWSSINETFERCKKVVGVGAIEDLSRDGTATRFSKGTAFRFLEEHWDNGVATHEPEGIRVALCANPEAEVTFAARELIAFVRSGNRFRDCAVLLRGMEGYQDTIRRVFARFGIPNFLDRRESISHHALAELTRCALQMVVSNWKHDDWFGALKTGLVSVDEDAIDRLENEALARGWKGDAWLSPIMIEGEVPPSIDRLRVKLIAPFLKLRESLQGKAVSGEELADALRTLWQDLRVDEQLQTWEHPEQNATVWQQMVSWLDDVELAFGKQKIDLREWLPILEAGLSGLTIGVIPPALDQVVVGTIDRSRNPELKLAIVLGMNEGVFPATPKSSRLLNESEREALSGENVLFGRNTREMLGRERFFAYIACTRARERLVVTCSERDAQDNTLNQSSFITRLQELFPKLPIEKVQTPSWQEAEHACELAAPMVTASEKTRAQPLFQLPAFESLQKQLRFCRANGQINDISPRLVEALYGKALRTSVSRLERFAACAFRFFIDSGLRAEERRKFELDVRERGTFQHEVLYTFHQQLKNEGRTWHSITPNEARERMGQIGHEAIPKFRDGLLMADAASRYSAQSMVRSLQDFIFTIVGWMKQYEFEPRAVELRFDSKHGDLPSWELPLGDGHSLLFRGAIDRIDLLPVPNTQTALAVVMDYKSSGKKLDPLSMTHGLQLQLLAYLTVLRTLPQAAQMFGYEKLIPAGVFYVNLRGDHQGGDSRDEVLGDPTANQSAYRHFGRFDFAQLKYLDSSESAGGTQFNYQLTNSKTFNKRNKDPMDSNEFEQLLKDVEANLIRMGRNIYQGTIAPNPFQKGGDRACDNCEYQGACRIDPWKHQFRGLE